MLVTAERGEGWIKILVLQKEKKRLHADTHIPDLFKIRKKI